MRASTIDDNDAWADLDTSDVKVIYAQILSCFSMRSVPECWGLIKKVEEPSHARDAHGKGSSSAYYFQRINPESNLKLMVLVDQFHDKGWKRRSFFVLLIHIFFFTIAEHALHVLL